MSWLSLDLITTVHSGLTIGYIQVSIHLDILFILLSNINFSQLQLQLDIHSGWEDLRFPRHKNKLALLWSYFSCTQWVNYWLHTGKYTPRYLVVQYIWISTLEKKILDFLTMRMSWLSLDPITTVHIGLTIGYILVSMHFNSVNLVVQYIW